MSKSKMLYEREYLIKLESVEQKILYLRQITTHLNNALLQPGLRENVYLGYINALLATLKLMSEIQTGKALEEIEDEMDRLGKLAEERKHANHT